MNIKQAGNMEKEIKKCDKCGWRGYEDELQVNPVSLDGGEDVTFIKVCPKCNDEDYLIDPWEDDSEG